MLFFAVLHSRLEYSSFWTFHFFPGSKNQPEKLGLRLLFERASSSFRKHLTRLLEFQINSPLGALLGKPFGQM
jgi:hypothetical protein